jgi:hypothetical protein
MLAMGRDDDAATSVFKNSELNTTNDVEIDRLIVTLPGGGGASSRGVVHSLK